MNPNWNGGQQYPGLLELHYKCYLQQCLIDRRTPLTKEAWEARERLLQLHSGKQSLHEG